MPSAYWTLVLLLDLRRAEQPPFAVDLAQVEVVVALAALRLIVHFDLPARMLLPLEGAEDGDLAARARLRVLPAQLVVHLAFGERLARGVHEDAQVLVVEALGRAVLQQADPVLRQRAR